MNDKFIQHHLRQLAERAVPDHVDLWPAIRAKLDSSRRGDIAMNILKRNHRLRVLAIATLALILTLGALTTPWGLAFAQSLFRFFPVAPADSFPLPTEQIQFYGAEPTIPPTFAAQLKPITPTPIESEETATPMPPIFAAPVISGCEDSATLLTYRCQVSKAEAAVGFDLKEPPGDLEGLVFSHAGANPTLRFANLIYTAIGGGSQLTISQVRGDMSAHTWDEVPPSAAVENVKVGGNDGEYVRGIFVVKPGATSATWQADGPVRRLRWREGDVLFQIRLDGHVARVEWLEKDTMIALAESLVYKTNTTEGQLRADYLTSVKDAEALAGFDLLEPMVLPEGFSFKYAEFDAISQRVRLVYEAATGAGTAGIVIFQTPITVAPNTDFAEGLPPDAVETVQIGEATALYIAGAYDVLPVPTPGIPTPAPSWNPDDPQRSLIWRTDGLLVEVYFFSSQWYGGRLEKADMIAIAESMK